MPRLTGRASCMGAPRPFQHLVAGAHHRLMRSAAGTEKVEELLPDRIGSSIVAHEIADIHDLIGLERHRSDAAVRRIDPCRDVVSVML